MPDYKLYYEASCLCWLKEWITLENTDLLDLEGYDNRFRWHSYFWHDKVKVHKGFLNHVIRKIYEVWDRYKNLLERKTAWRLSPTEVLSVKKLNMEGTYSEILMETEKGLKLKPYDQIEEVLTGWL